MCGIAGYVGPDRLPEGVAEAMMNRLVHRGPDDWGSYADDRAVLTSRLLSIVDIGHGRQPFFGAYGKRQTVGVYNGELYNWREIRRDLEALGMEFRTHCDTEVAIGAIAAWGKDAFRRFDGQWALAAWDPQAGELLLSRDPFGIKPLFYWSRGATLVFGSEPKALFAHPAVPRRPDPVSIVEYLTHGFAFAAGYSTSSRSFYEGVSAVPPGHYLSWSAETGVRIFRHFEIPVETLPLSAQPGQVAEDLGVRVRESVDACLMGDAPVGVALSGGLDSSIIASHAARRQTEQGKPALLASTIRYASQPHNEDAAHAAMLADWLEETAPLRLVHANIPERGYLEHLDDLIFHFDEPHWEIKQLAMFENYRSLKANGAKVVLTGEGADELFFGYYHRFPGFLHPRVSTPGDLRACWRARLPAVHGLLAPGWHGTADAAIDDGVERFYTPWAERGLPSERCMQLWYLQTFLHWLLLDNDRCSMAHSLEGRFPFLNRSVFEIALSIPPSWQVGDAYGQEKLVLRQAFAGDLPHSIAWERKKAPLPSPDRLAYHATVADAASRALDAAPQGIWDLLDREGVRSLLQRHERKVRSLGAQGSGDTSGEELTRYLTLDSPVSVRTPQVFGLLTLFRWWEMNF